MIPPTRHHAYFVPKRRGPAGCHPFIQPAPCGICGGPDAEHRVRDAIASRLRAGESERDVARDYRLTVRAVRRIKTGA